ncbi:MAG: ABC transporter ATP-binding protein [Saprospiraceae bacterium]
MIEIQATSKTFGKLPVLRDINLRLDKGECIALIGPNGCGKTTLIKSILGMVMPDTGDILFNGKSIKGDDSYRRNIGYMPQIGRYPENMSIGQVLSMIKGIRNSLNPLDEVLYQEFEIEKMLHKRMRTLSGGTVQKVSATIALLFNPEVLILDEPTAGLDPLAAEILKTMIIKKRDEGALILITSHILSELEDIVTQVVFMQSGDLIFHKDVSALKLESGQNTISKSIIHILKQRTE